MATRLYARRNNRLQELSSRLWNWPAVRRARGRWRGTHAGCRRTAYGALAAGLVLAAHLVFSGVMAHQGYRAIPLAKPALPSVSWEQRVTVFGGKLVEVFDLGPGAANEFAGWILEAADRQRLEPELIASLVQVESAFRKNARSHVGAVGPAQVRPRYWSEFCGGDDLTNPGYNIHCGAQVLAYLKELCGDGDCALGAYNVGRNSTRKQAARRFVSKVAYHRLQLKTL